MFEIVEGRIPRIRVITDALVTEEYFWEKLHNTGKSRDKSRPSCSKVEGALRATNLRIENKDGGTILECLKETTKGHKNSHDKVLATILSVTDDWGLRKYIEKLEEPEPVQALPANAAFERILEEFTAVRLSLAAMGVRVDGLTAKIDTALSKLQRNVTVVDAKVGSKKHKGSEESS